MMIFRSSNRRGALPFWVRLASSFVTNFDKSISDLPMREAVRYCKLNKKFSAEEIKTQVESHANALLEIGFKGGDTIAVWFKESAEKHVTLLAAAKAGFVVADIDTAIGSVAEVRDALSRVKCKALFLDPVTDERDNLLLLRKSIPELYHFDDMYGQHFHSKYYPQLKYFVHTGFDVEVGFVQYKTIFVPNPPESEVRKVARTLKDSTPAYFKVFKEGDGSLKQSPVITHADLLEHSSWQFAKNIVTKQYFEVA